MEIGSWKFQSLVIRMLRGRQSLVWFFCFFQWKKKESGINCNVRNANSEWEKTPSATKDEHSSECKELQPPSTVSLWDDSRWVHIITRNHEHGIPGTVHGVKCCQEGFADSPIAPAMDHPSYAPRPPSGCRTGGTEEGSNPHSKHWFELVTWAHLGLRWARRWESEGLWLWRKGGWRLVTLHHNLLRRWGWFITHQAESELGSCLL